MFEGFIEVQKGHHINITAISDINTMGDYIEIVTPGRAIKVEKGCEANVLKLLRRKKNGKKEKG